MGLTTTKVGEDLVLILPPELLDYLGVSVGDRVHLTETEKGFRLASHSDDFDEAMIHAKFVMLQNEAALRRLAK